MTQRASFGPVTSVSARRRAWWIVADSTVELHDEKAETCERRVQVDPLRSLHGSPV
jgi:hypothetical protein